MLSRIIVKDFAIIEDIDFSFKSGMTVLTGQTGAGKSLIIDAIGLLLGARADSDMIRYGKDKSVVTGVFTDLSDDLKTRLDELDIKYDSDLTITREISANGKNTIKINNSNLTLTELKSLGLRIGDIHVQHDTYRLINKDNYLSFLDDFRDSKFLNLFNSYVLSLDTYKQSLKKYNDAKTKAKSLGDRLEYLKYEKDELDSLNLKENLDTELSEEIEKLKNFDKIYNNLNEAYENIVSEAFNLDILYDAFSNLKKISDYDELYSENAQRLEEAYYAIDDVKSYLYKEKDSLDFDPEYLESLQSREFELDKAKSKYHKTVKELMEYLEEITTEINLAENYDEAIKELEEDLKKKYDSLFDKASKLSEYRKKKALEIEKLVIKECKDLDLENTLFKVAFTNPIDKNIYSADGFMPNGFDDIDFLVSFNLGEPVKPLAKVASGGELSRLMLAFKVIYISKNGLSFMVFDEIDSGVSGKTAYKIAKKMVEISKSVQVMAITHLAQVAAFADNQLLISKQEANGRTSTLIKELEYEERVYEVARMLSGMEITPAFLETARELLKK